MTDLETIVAACAKYIGDSYWEYDIRDEVDLPGILRQFFAPLAAENAALKEQLAKATFSDADDSVLERWDQTEPAMQRRIIYGVMARLTLMQEQLAAATQPVKSDTHEAIVTLNDHLHLLSCYWADAIDGADNVPDDAVFARWERMARPIIGKLFEQLAAREAELEAAKARFAFVVLDGRVPRVVPILGGDVLWGYVCDSRLFRTPEAAVDAAREKVGQ